jgi:pSer/pThr/pTyr-binding forkhead associated (FHA) protein
MRIQFPNAEHPEVAVDGGRLLVGSAVSGEDTLNLPGLQAQHIAIEVDRVRGIWLSVADGRDVLVNGRPVRERAQLRLGDSIFLGKLHLLIKPDTDFRESPPPAETGDPQRAPIGRASLRALSGPYFGKSVHLQGRTVIGRDPACDVILDEPAMPARHAVIENLPEGLYLRDLGANRGTEVNGIHVLSTVLQPGDQVAFEQNRFVVEAPGWQPLARQPVNVPTPPPRAHSTQVQRRLVPPPGSPGAPPLPGAGSPSPAELHRSSQVTNWILAIAALVTLIALGTVIFLSVNHSL